VSAASKTYPLATTGSLIVATSTRPSTVTVAELLASITRSAGGLQAEPFAQQAVIGTPTNLLVESGESLAGVNDGEDVDRFESGNYRRRDWFKPRKSCRFGVRSNFVSQHI
jgi:hypothetical protein